MKFIIITFLMSFVLIQNGFSQDYQTKTIKIGHVFYLDIPEYFVRTTSLNNSAIVQYMNEMKGAYLIVIDDNKEEINLSGGNFVTPKDYFDFFLSGFKTDDTNILSAQSLKINGYDAYQSEITANIDILKIYYLITIIESKDYFYNIICWSLFNDKDKFKNEYIKIANSFKEE